MSEIFGKPYECTSDNGTTFVAHLYEDNAEMIVQRRSKDGYESIDLSKPDAIDLGKRLLEHFDVLPGKPELHCVILALDSFMDVCEEYGAMMPGTENRTKIDATIAKLRRLVGE